MRAKTKRGVSWRGPGESFGRLSRRGPRTGWGITWLALALTASFDGCSPSPRAPARAETGAAPARPARRGPADKPRESARVDLEALAGETPEYQGQGRDLFAFGRGRAAPPAEILPPPPTPTPPPQAGDWRPGGPPTPRIDLKFAGYIEKPYPDGKKVKYAIFLDGQQVLTGAEGEVVANRYRIVEIGLESVTLAPTGSNTTQRIPLRAN
jgi:hypothetical protein